MRYRAISADGHVNEPPTLWTDRLPAKFKDRGPHIIETPKTKGHAWIMEGQKRPSPMGFSSMYSRASKRFDRASLIDSFKQIKDRGVRYEDMFPGSYDPAARVKEILEDETDAEVIFNGVQTVWNGIKLCPDPELSLACYKVYNDWIAEFQAYAPERFVCNATLPTTGIDDASTSCTAVPISGCARPSSSRIPAARSRTPRPRTTGSGRPPSSWACRSTSTSVLLPRRRPGIEDRREGAWPSRRSGRRFAASISMPARSPSSCGGRSPRASSNDSRISSSWAPKWRRAGCPTTSNSSTSLCCGTGTSGTCRSCRASTSAATSPSSTWSTRSVSAQPLRHRRGKHHVGPRLPALVELLAGRLPDRPRSPRTGRGDERRDRADHVEERSRSVLVAL